MFGGERAEGEHSDAGKPAGKGSSLKAGDLKSGRRLTVKVVDHGVGPPLLRTLRNVCGRGQAGRSTVAWSYRGKRKTALEGPHHECVQACLWPVRVCEHMCPCHIQTSPDLQHHLSSFLSWRMEIPTRKTQRSGSPPTPDSRASVCGCVEGTVSKKGSAHFHSSLWNVFFFFLSWIEPRISHICYRTAPLIQHPGNSPEYSGSLF